MTLTGLEPSSLWLGAHCSYTERFSFPGAVYNAGPERDSICRAWGQHHVETFDGLYYYLSGKGSYTLVGRHEPEGQTFSVQVRPPLTCLSSKAPLGPGGWCPLSQACTCQEAAQGAMPCRARTLTDPALSALWGPTSEFFTAVIS